MKLDPKELNKLLEQVSSDVAGILAKAEESEMEKASPGEEAPGEETPAGSSTEGSAPDAAPEAPADGASDAGPPEGSPAEEAQEAPADESQEQNPATDESAGPEALVGEYAKLPIEELKMHVMAAHATLMQAIGDGQPGEGDQPAPDGQPEVAPEGQAPESTPPAGTEPPMGKKEIKASPGNGGQIKSGGKMAKSETEMRLAKLEKAVSEKD